MDKRYQVFVSSTYADLKQERARVIQTVIEMDCIPAGMELFPAADKEQFKFIKHVIDDCDYYLLIIGGRYGSTTAEGVSYTEKEYDYAISRGLKVIAFVHGDPDTIPLGKSEKDASLRAKLEKFREKVSTGRLVKKWNSAEELPGLVALSLNSTLKMYPAVGWVRANRIASEDLLAEINDLRKENARLQTALAEFTGPPDVDIPDLAGLDETIEFHGVYWNKSYRRNQSWSVKVSWREVFGYIAPYLDSYPLDSSVKGTLSSALFKKSDADGINQELDDQEFRTVAVQLKALGLVSVNYSETVGRGMGLFWSLTTAGKRLMIEIRTVRKSGVQKF